MRPLQLRMSGLRSYRTETTVDFSDLNLLAIVGATGSGKSSLLEAITYALYGTATWGGRNVKSLIADGALRMSVSLSFEADGQQWLITRTTPSGNYPPGSQELSCLSDPVYPKIDGSAEVRMRVTELIGLDYEGFKSCVLLPQGRFDQLLKSAAADRVGILKGILGLDALNEMWTRAKELERVVQDRYDEIRDARGQFLPNPREINDFAEAQIASLKPRMQELTQLEKRVETLVEEVRAHQDRIKTATGAADRLFELTDDDLLARLRHLEELATKLTRVRADAASTAKAAEREARDANQAVRQAKESGRSAVAITGLRGTIGAAGAELKAIARDRSKLDGKRTQLTEDRTRLEAERARTAGLATTLEQHTEAEKQAETAAKEAREAATALINRIETVVTAREQLEVAETDLRDRRAESEKALEQKTSALAHQQQKDAALTQAQTALDEAHRADAAAQAAHGCQPGDSCPVCTQPLPDAFVAPESSADLTARREALAAANRDERSAFDDLTQAKAATKTAAELVRTATTSRDTAKAAWTELEATPLPGHLDATTVVADQATTALVNAPVEQAEQQLLTAKTKRTTTAQEHQKAVALVQATEGALTRREQELGDEADGIARREQDVRVSLSLLPDWVDVPETAESADLDARDEQLGVALQEAETREQLAATAAETVTERQKELSAAKDRIQAEVDGPATSERTSLRALAAEADRHREEPLPAAPPVPATIPDLIAWGEQIVTAASDQLATLQATAEDERQAAETKQTKGVALLKEAGFEKSTDLHEAVTELVGDVKHATAERRRAAAQLKPAAQLDALAAQAERLRGGLRELAFQLGDGKFVGFVVEQRQRALLALASGIFGEVTGGQYGFTEDFRIVDRQTGTARTPDTLSGGETFLASLALALGLVELAGRSGGRLQALFLDEGFGSLDPDALDQALNELERRAATGRLIALISHVPAIAERIEQVLQVTKTPQGSQVRLLTEQERAALLLDDATQQVASAA